MDLPVLLHGELPGGNPEEAEPSASSWARPPGSEVHVVQVADRIVSGMDSPLTRVSTGGRETGPLAPGLLRKRASPVKGCQRGGDIEAGRTAATESFDRVPVA